MPVLLSIGIFYIPQVILNNLKKKQNPLDSAFSISV